MVTANRVTVGVMTDDAPSFPSFPSSPSQPTPPGYPTDYRGDYRGDHRGDHQGGPAGPPPPPYQPFGAPYAGAGVGPRPVGPPTAPLAPPLGQALPQRPATARGRRRFAAGVITAALLVGGGAGLGGAAAWEAIDDDPATTATAAAPVQVSSDDQGSTSNASTGTSVEAVAAKVLPSVVEIEVSGAQGSGSGSGIIMSPDGQILTNNHVVELAQGGGSLRVSFNDGTSATATVLGTDPLTDTALIQAAGVSGLTPATIGTSGDLEVGQGVVAVGSPFGLASTVTSGIVSALDRPVDVGSDDAGNVTAYPAIQTDAAINPGNSGGALTDMSGNVVGINASIRTADSSSSEQSGSIGLGFAIPIDEVLPIIEQMANGQIPTHARLGVKVADVGADAASGDEGALIKEVTDGSTTSQAGIAAGDVVTKIDDHIITSADSLVATIRSYRPGDQVTVTYLSGGKTATAQLTLDSDESTTTS